MQNQRMTQAENKSKNILKNMEEIVSACFIFIFCDSQDKKKKIQCNNFGVIVILRV